MGVFERVMGCGRDKIFHGDFDLCKDIRSVNMQNQNKSYLARSP